MHAESAPNSDSTMRYSHGASSPGGDQIGQRLHDVGLRGDGVRRHDVRAAPGHGLGDRARTLQLPKHGLRSPASGSITSVTSVLGQPDVRVDDAPGPRRRTDGGSHWRRLPAPAGP